jgi:hypothetical protein
MKGAMLLAALLLAVGASAQRESIRRAGGGGRASGGTVTRSAPPPAGSAAPLARERVVPGQAPAPRTWGGRRYWVYHDHFGPWYGWYAGPSFYWARWHRNRWWWWHDGIWFYYYDDDWVPAPSGEPPPPEAAPPAAPAAAAPAAPQPPMTGGAWWSPDKTRLVQIAGPSGDAFLYDATASTETPRFMERLAPGAERARFSGGEGRPLTILVDLRDGRFLLFDKDGKPL